MMKVISLLVGVSMFLVSPAMAECCPTKKVQDAALIADAETRSSLTGANFAGHDANGFFISGGDGFRLNIGGDARFRYIWNTNREGGKDNNIGFNDPLVRLSFNGNLNEQIDFMLQGGFDRQGQDASLLDTYVGIKAFDTGRFQVGQFKLPFMKEVNIDERYQLTIERSVVSYVFGQGRSQGVQFSYDIDSLRLIGAVSDGFDTANTNFTDPAESDFAGTLRAEYIILGSHDSFNQFTSNSNDDNSLLAGAAFHYQEGTTQSTMYTYTGDLTWKNRGWNAFLSGVGRNLEEPGISYNDFGLAVQGGYRVTEKIEPFTRYDAIFADSDRGFSNNNFNFATAGVNYYLYGQSAKITADMVYSFNETTGLGSMTNFSDTGLLGSTGEGEMAFRMQFQFLF